MENRNNNPYASIPEALTFDDVLLVPDYSNVLPREVDLSTQITKDLKINVPILSAAMDTVTEHRLAIAMARQGGLGFIHKNMTVDQQADQVRKVKRSESGMITDPVTLHPESSVGEALELMRLYKIGGIPVINKDNRLVGILTNRDLRFETSAKKLVQEIMTTDNLITAPEGTDLKQAKSILQKYKIEKLPVVNDIHQLVGLITYKDIIKVQNYPNSAKDSRGRLMVGAAVGVSGDTFDRIAALQAVDVDILCVDTAHGHSQGVLDRIKEIKTTFPNIQLVGGNVASEEGASALIDAGVDCIKVGVGPGSICTTRVVAGVGVPQLSAIMGAYRAAKKHGIPIIADGGIRYTGDIVKALAAGADCIMAGSLFAGTEEAPGDTMIFDGRKFKIYRGMGSVEAMAKGSKDRYFQDTEDDIKKLVPEGIEGRVPYKGTLAEVMLQYTGGLRAGMGYVGASKIEEIKGKKMVKITTAGVTENHPHDVTITKEAPNYSRRS